MSNTTNWKKVILFQEDTMESAIKVLNKESLRIIIVVNENKQLVGTVTDGDIRRAIMRHFGMETVLKKIMFNNPTTADINDERREILSLMQNKDILQIPIIDKDRKILGLETLHNILGRKKFDNPVFLMAGGFGERLKPLTDDVPKPLLKVGNKPILERIISQFVDAGFHNFYISTHYKANMVRKYFGNGEKWNISIQYVHEEDPLGTAGALGLLPSDLSKLPLIMMNGDLLTNIDYESLLKFHNEHEGVATICVSEYDFQIPYGVIKSSNQRLLAISEKPIHKFFINAGIYVVDHSIVLSVDGKTHIDMPKLLEQKVNEQEIVNIFPLHEYWLDIGQKEQLEKARIDSEKLFE